MTKEEIQLKIEALKEERKNAHGEQCEVYTRCVGYLRPVKQMNHGKRAEIKQRTMFNKNIEELKRGQREWLKRNCK